MAPAPGTRHIVIDMQRVFAEDTAWHTPAVMEILPNVILLSRAYEQATLYAKFMLPRRSEDAAGNWQNYYRRWSMLTTENMDPAMQDLVEPLNAMASHATIVEKTAYSVFSSPGFRDRMDSERVDTLLFSGVETDVCVLASVFDAVDAGFKVIVATDAVGSSAPDSHRATLDVILPRMPDQIFLATTTELLALT